MTYGQISGALVTHIQKPTNLHYNINLQQRINEEHVGEQDKRLEIN